MSKQRTRTDRSTVPHGSSTPVPPPPPRRGWLPWAAGVVAIGLFITGGYLFAERTGRLPRLTHPDQAGLQNRLAGAKSPYLRSAAGQPVAWQQWTPEAFRLAQTLDRPIWLDIGAIWCHWCHVMDRESYEKPDIAALINRHFVPVKVDRDERPDIDSRYQIAFQLINGTGGGWPLTMFLTPTGEPFAGGTYFPPEGRGGQPGLRDIAPQVAAAFREQRGRVAEVANAVRADLARLHARAGAAGSVSPDLARAIAKGTGTELDPIYGGFGRDEGPKFPGGEAIQLALAEGFLEGDTALTRSSLFTLQAYAKSGMRDHVHGGFFRYSVNRALTVPHFEKMDYVQAALLRVYLDAYRLTRDSTYAGVARDIMRYVNSTLSDRALGGFYAHQDADISLDDDGSYYTWSPAQLKAALPPDEVEAVRLYYDVSPQGEMRTEPSQNVLRIARSVAQVARSLRIPEAEARRRIQDGNRRLEAARRVQKAPFVERTKFTDRNGMLISAYLEAYQTLGDTAARDFAVRTLDFLLARTVDSSGTVHHATAEGQSYIADLMADYAYLTDALVDGYQVTGNETYLRRAERIMNRAVAVFWDQTGGGFYDRAADPRAPALLTDRTKDFTDSPLPGPNAVAGRALDKLYLLTSDERWRDLAEKTLNAFAGAAADRGSFVAAYGLAAEAHTRKPPQTVIIGPARDRRTSQLADAAWRTYRPGRLVAIYDPTTVVLDSLPEAVAGAARVFRADPSPRAYVCVGETCAPPTTDTAAVADLVRTYGLRQRR